MEQTENIPVETQETQAATPAAQADARNNEQPKYKEDESGELNAKSKTMRRLGQVQMAGFNLERYVGHFLNYIQIIGFGTAGKYPNGEPYIDIVRREDMSDRGQLRMRLAKGLTVPKIMEDELMVVFAAIQGVRDENGRYQAIPIARRFGPPNVHQVNPQGRTLLDMTDFDEETGKVNLKDADQLRKLQLKTIRHGINQQNHVQLSGYVEKIHTYNMEYLGKEIGELGEHKWPYIEVLLRQDANPNNLIPVRLITNRIDMFQNLLQGMANNLLTITGQLKTEKIPELVRDEEGRILLGDDGEPLQLKDENGEVVYRYNSFVKCTQTPARATSNEVLFLHTDGRYPMPKWMADIVRELKAKKDEAEAKKATAAERRAAADKAAEAELAAKAAQAPTPTPTPKIEEEGDGEDF